MGFDALDGVMKMRIEFLAHASMRFSPCFASESQSWRRISSNPFRYSAEAESSALSSARSNASSTGRMLSISNSTPRWRVVMAFFFDALAIILEIRLAAHQRVHQFLFLGLKFLQSVRWNDPAASRHWSELPTPAGSAPPASRCFGPARKTLRRTRTRSFLSTSFSVVRRHGINSLVRYSRKKIAP